VRKIMGEMRHDYRAVLEELLRELGVKRAATEPAAVYLIACLEGLALEQLERGETQALKRARAVFVRSAGALASG
jgi:hypothetical protein